MAEETTVLPETAPTKVAEDVVVVSDVPVAEKPTAPEKQLPPSPPEKPAAEEVLEVEVEVEKIKDDKIIESASFKEESNVVGELPDPQKKALEELKLLVQEALNKHEFTALPPSAATAEEPKSEDKSEDVGESDIPPPPPPATMEELPAKSEAEEAAAAAPPPAQIKEEEKVASPPPPPEAVVKPTESKEEEKAAAAAEGPEPVVVVAEVVEKVTAAVDEDGAKTVEAIEETIVPVSAPDAPAPAPAPAPAQAPAPATEAPPEEPEKEPAAAAGSAPPAPEEVSIWGIPLLADERSDVILLKFLRARDFKVKEAFIMLKNTVRWRKDFGIESLLEENLGSELEKVVFMHGVDKEGHPVCYNAYGEFQNKELYQNAFADKEKRQKFLRWRIQFLEKSIRKLDFTPDRGICTFVQVNDLKNSPGPSKRELRIATNQALQLLQDNYPEFLAKQVFINVPWWYLAFFRMISPFLTQRTKSKFVFAGHSKSAETLFKYIAPEQVPVQFGGLSREGEQEFTAADPVTEEIIKPASKQTVEFPVPEACTLIWEARVVGWDVNFGAEFVPTAEGEYTVIVQKNRKFLPADETVISYSFRSMGPGKLVLTFNNQTSKKKKLLYRMKTKSSD